ncbi:deoxynucleotidyltransferase terminal-interacting protein 2 [Centroberyx affinis]|uniref:deoxynucleotidyltransferase terminal-interacting protein 2 n=1 Tax=Centroberyx affinis TaxID=166261 RepID=UPI003A5BDC8E
MVATRRGVRVYSPTKTNSDQSSAVQATPSTGRRTRRTAKQADSPSQHAQEEETSSQPDDCEGGPPVSPQSQTCSMKRCSRASRLHSPEQPSTPVGSTHEADVSDLESCCSAVSDIEPRTPRTRGKRRQPRPASRQEEEVSEVESCSSAVSASKGGRSARRSTRKKAIPESSHPAEVESCGSVVLDSQRVTRSQRKSARTRSSAKRQTEDSELSDADSCMSSVSGADVSASITGRATRSSRRIRPIPMHLDEVSEGSQSPDPVGRRTRAARGKAAASVVVSEPQSCESDGFESGPSVTPQRTTRSRGKARSTGPKAVDSDSDLTDVHSPLGSPCSMRGRGTPCSSRTGSGTSSRAAPSTRLSAKALSVVLERASTPRAQDRAAKVTVSEAAEEEAGVLNGSRLESTVIADPECTLLEEDMTLTLEEEEEGVTASNDVSPEEAGVIEVGRRGSVTLSVTADVEMDESASTLPSTTTAQESTDTKETAKEVIVITVEDDEMDTPADSQLSLSQSVTVSDSPCRTEEAQAVGEPAMTARDQQREPSAESEDGAASEVALMQETVPSSQPLELPSCQSVAVTVCGRAVTSEVTEETEEKDKAMEISDVDTHPSQTERLEDKPVDGDATVETLPGGEEEEEEEEEMEVSASHGDAQQVVGSSEVPPSPAEPNQVESIQVTSSKEQKVKVESCSEQQPEASVIVSQNTGTISLLESSEDEDEDEYVEEEEEEEEREGSGEEEEEDLERMEEERAGPSKKPEAAAASVDGLFMIDTRPGQEADEQYYQAGPSEKGAGTKGEEAEQEEQDEEEFVDEAGDDDDEDAQILFSSKNPQLKELSSRIDPGLRVKELGGLYINFDGSKSKPVSSSLKKLKEQKIQDEVMKKSVIGPDFEKKDAVPPYSESKQALKLKRQAERKKTTGEGWFNMKAPELTPELRGDLKVLKMRGSMDSKRFYKKNDRDGFPKYFQVGTVVDNPADFYHSRIPKKERKRTMVEELLADAEFRHNNKKKYQQIMTDRAAQGAGKRNKKKNKFHKK